ncbi:MAG: 3-oxoacyl-[acyl-carrier-protein] reductase [Calditrichia bacterium]|nr:3-oxoacyl-[acyl-carrier-protein] reductase [Calditrichia bacterium]
MLKEKVAIVTGSARGIGRAIAQKLAENGAKVVICDIDAETTGKVADEFNANGFIAIGVAADVSKLEDSKDLIKKAVEEWGRVDILVNNAGITRDNLLALMKEEEWDSVMSVNLRGPFNCVKSVSRQMMKQRYGKIINISSVVGVTGNAGQSNYSASKAGLIGFTKSIAKELSGRNILCNAIAPGFIETAMTDKLSDKVKEDLMRNIPLKKLGQGEDIANTVLFLSSDLSNYITGQVINVDGGMVM